MLNLMQSVDFAITAGSTVWEYMKVGVPFISIKLFENQKLVKTFLTIINNLQALFDKKSEI